MNTKGDAADVATEYRPTLVETVELARRCVAGTRPLGAVHVRVLLHALGGLQAEARTARREADRLRLLLLDRAAEQERGTAGEPRP